MDKLIKSNVNMVHNELYVISKHLKSHISRVYDGKIIPLVKHHYLNMISGIIDPKLAVMSTYWNLLEENTFNCDFRAIIISSFDDEPSIAMTHSELAINKYKKMVSQKNQHKIDNIFNKECVLIVDETFVTDITEFKKKNNKNNIIDNKKAILMIVSKNINIPLSQIINQFSPDLILIDQINQNVIKRSTKNLYQFLNTTCSKSIDITNKYTNIKNTAIISFTKNINIDKLIETTGLENIMVNYKCRSISETINLHDSLIHLRLIEMNPNKANIDIDINNNKVMQTLNDIFKSRKSNPLKKIVVITKTKKDADNMRSFYKNIRKRTDNYCHNLIDINSYDAENSIELSVFLNLYVRDDTVLYLDANNHNKLLMNSIKKRTDSGILFIETDKFAKLIESCESCIFKNIDTVVVLDDTLKNEQILYESLLFMLIDNKLIKTDPTINLTFVEIKENNIQTQLHRLGTILYSHNKSNVEILDMIKDNISNQIIKIDDNFNTKLQNKIENKLEKLFEITQKDIKRHNCTNTIYIVPVSKMSTENKNYSQLMHVTSEHYKIEKKYMNINIDHCELQNQIEMIKKNKSKQYSGPKWISTSDKEEISKNKIGFFIEHKGLIEICEIIDVHKFTRKDKRAEWKEKENRDKNILFLSPVIKKIKMANFRKLTGLKKDDTIKYMQEFMTNINASC